MAVTLTVVAGPHLGKQFSFVHHDTFLVGRSAAAHFQMPRDDPYFSRRHFLIEVNPPRCRLLDLGSHNGTYVNQLRVQTAELKEGDEVRAGHTTLRIRIQPSIPECEPIPDECPVIPAGVDITTHFTPALPHIPGHALHSLIGQGGMGLVYLGTCLADGTSVAVKTIRPSRTGSRKPIDLFLRETRVLRELSHPHIVGFRDQGEHQGMLYLVMEFIRGADAASILRDHGPMPIRTAVRLVYQVLKGLAHAHAKGFVHRDIKPANILIEERPPKRTAKLADFGLARAFAGSELSGLTMQGEVSGTIAYMAPEQVTHLREVKPPADQYSVAATLYHLLTAEYPHDLPRSPVDQLVHILTREAVPIRERRPDVPDGLAESIHKALARDPEDRFADVDAFRQALRPFARM